MTNHRRDLTVKRTTIAAACLALAAPVALAPAPAYATTPCYMLTDGSFSSAEFTAWYDGPRWGASLSNVEDNYAGCAGVWASGTYGTWNGHTEQMRVWPRSDGGQTEIVFAKYDTAPTWRAHDMAETYNSSGYFRRECEWPRPSGAGSCSPA